MGCDSHDIACTKYLRKFVKSVSTIIIKVAYFLNGASVTTKFEGGTEKLSLRAQVYDILFRRMKQTFYIGSAAHKSQEITPSPRTTRSSS